MSFRIVRHVMTDRPIDDNIVALLREVFVGEGFAPTTAANAFSVSALRARGLLWVALADEVVVGTVFLVEPGSEYRQIATDEELEVHLLAVSSTQRRAGVGEGLLSEVLREAKARGASRLVLSSQPTMPAAHALYEKCGFRRNAARDWSRPDGRVYQAFELAC